MLKPDPTELVIEDIAQLSAKITEEFNKLQNAMNSLASRSETLKSNIMDQFAQITERGAFIDINNDLIQLQSLSILFTQPVKLVNIQTICGPAIEKCNMAFLNVCSKL